MHSVKFQTGCTNRRVWSCRVETSGLRFFEIREATSQLRDELATVDPCSEEVICRVSSSILRRMKSWSWNQSHAMYTILTLTGPRIRLESTVTASRRLSRKKSGRWPKEAGPVICTTWYTYSGM